MPKKKKNAFNEYFFFLQCFKKQTIHHQAMSDIKMAFWINGSLTSSAEDMDIRLSPLTVTKKKLEWKLDSAVCLIGQENRSLTIMTQIHLWFFESPLFYCCPMFLPSPLAWQLSIGTCLEWASCLPVTTGDGTYGLRTRGHFDNGCWIEANVCQWLCCLLIAKVVRA